MPRFSFSSAKQQRFPGYFFASIVDCSLFAICGYLAFQLRFDTVPSLYLHPMRQAILVWAVVKSAVFVAARVNRSYWRYTSLDEASRIGVVNTAGSILAAAIILLALQHRIPHSIYVLEWLVSSIAILGVRLAVRMTASASKNRKNGEYERAQTLIYGAGAAGLTLAREIRANQSMKCYIVGFIDDERGKVGLSFHGKKVLGTGEALSGLAKKYNIDRVLIAIPSATGPQMTQVLQHVIDAEVDYKMIPGLDEILDNTELGQQIRDVAVEDLLGRKPVQLDSQKIKERIHGKTVMVTGAAGSIGSEICRQVARFGPAVLIGFDEAETPLFQLDRELNNKFPDLKFVPEIGNITRIHHLKQSMDRYKPSILFHAAAYKHVPMMERHVFAAVENNIFGTWNVAKAAIDSGVEDFLMISSDKAVRPTSMMGATKRASELVIRALQKESSTCFVAVRFGNVLGSNGSVVPIFKEQIAKGGPVTVTHPDMRRYFMTIPEAAQLVLQAFAIGKGGEVFVLDMGEPVRIVDLARNLVLLSGLRPDRDVKIEFTGLRPGEKLFEELNLQDEHMVPTSHAKICSYHAPFSTDLKVIRSALDDLQHIVERKDIPRLVLLLKELIPDYNPGSQLLKRAMAPSPVLPLPLGKQIPDTKEKAQQPVELKPATLLQ